jgi:ankyrin repeat protein
VQLCHILFDYNVDFNINDSTILKNILLDGDNILIKRLLTHPKINIRNPELLSFGFASNKQETINMIIEHKDFDINIRNDKVGSLINYLLGNNTLNNISKKLIERGIDIYMPNSEDKTPLDYCIEYNNREIFDTMLEKYRENNIPIEINEEVWEELAENNEDKSEFNLPNNLYIFKEISENEFLNLKRSFILR